MVTPSKGMSMLYPLEPVKASWFGKRVCDYNEVKDLEIILDYLLGSKSNDKSPYKTAEKTQTQKRRPCEDRQRKDEKKKGSSPIAFRGISDCWYIDFRLLTSRITS